MSVRGQPPKRDIADAIAARRNNLGAQRQSVIIAVVIRLGLVVSILAMCGTFAPAQAKTPSTQAALVKDTIAGGTHWRVETTRRKGPLHVWVPTNYEPATAGVVIYIHGFHTKVDKSWNERGLAEQFAASKRNALFIVCEAPSWGRGHVNWMSPNELIVTALEKTRVQRPLGDVVVVGHSGAHRTFRRWLTYRRLNHIVLLDAMYGHSPKYMRWLAQTKSHAENRITIVSIDTLHWTERLWHKRKDMVSMDRVPGNIAEVPAAALKARLLYMRSQHTHMSLVLKRKVIPVLLQMTRLKPL